jgi:hypothetical protein
LTKEETIRANARLAIETFRSSSDLGKRFGYDRESIEHVERFIEQERSRQDVTSESVARLVQVIGSYLGECVIDKYGGLWRESGGAWGVFFDESNAVFPFQKVRKQFEDGVDGGHSILSFFDLTGLVVLRRT